MTITQSEMQANRTTHSVVEGRSVRPSRLAASRILSETAHDLRSPLTSVRETIRLVANGELGTVSDTQQECLVDAIDICDSMERLITDMLQIERLQLGRARAMRKWFDLEPVCYGVAASLDSLLRPRHIAIAWDGIEATSPRAFGDADKINRLLCNLISNAARETAEHQHVLVRARRVHDDQTLKISVTDSGRGMNLEAWNRVAQRGTSERGSEGLGLSICRQLASAHHSPLTILSRLGQGTEISFELPIGGATSVATHWAQWRSQQREKSVPRRRLDIDIESDGNSDTEVGHQRVFTMPDSQMLLLHHEGPPPQNFGSALMLSVSVGATVASNLVEEFDQRLQRDQSAYDLVYRVSARRWVVVWDAKPEEAQVRIDALSVAEAETAGVALRLTWSEPRILNLASSRAAVVLADTLARESLHEREPAGLFDDDMSSDGGTEFAPSPIPAERLRAELSHLAARVGRQSQLLQRQARAANINHSVEQLSPTFPAS